MGYKPPGYGMVTPNRPRCLACSLYRVLSPAADGPEPTASVHESAIGRANLHCLKPSNSRQAKRLFVSNLPASVTEDKLLNFFNLQLNGLTL